MIVQDRLPHHKLLKSDTVAQRKGETGIGASNVQATATALELYQGHRMESSTKWVLGFLRRLDTIYFRYQPDIVMLHLVNGQGEAWPRPAEHFVINPLF